LHVTDLHGTNSYLAGVVQHDDLGGEVGHAAGVGGNVATLEILHADVLDVEADVVAGHGGAKVTTWPGLMMPVSTRPTGILRTGVSKKKVGKKK
jgi:hypothetical protein